MAGRNWKEIRGQRAGRFGCLFFAKQKPELLQPAQRERSKREALRWIM